MWLFSKWPERLPLLRIGDERGGVHLMWFLNPSKGLFKNPTKERELPSKDLLPCKLDFVSRNTELNVWFWKQWNMLIKLRFHDNTFIHLIRKLANATKWSTVIFQTSTRNHQQTDVLPIGISTLHCSEVTDVFVPHWHHTPNSTCYHAQDLLIY